MHKNILIVFWGNPFFDGRCMNMIDELLNKKHTISILGIGSEAEKLDYNGAHITLMSSKTFNSSTTKYLKYFRYVKNFIKNQKPEIIIASDLYSMIPVSKTKKYHNARIVYDSRELYTKLAGLKNKSIAQKIWGYYEKKYIKSVDCTLVTAEIDKDYLLQLYQNLNIKIIKNLPSNDFFNSQSVDLRAMLCINKEDNILIYQGKFHEGRGIRFVMQCMQKMENIVLVLIGDGPMKTKYMECAKKYNLENKIFFIDAVPYKSLSQFSADAYIGLSIIQPISKSYENALPNKLFEYAVAGIPTICSNLTAMKAMIDQYNSGIAIAYNSQTEFINAYKKIASHYTDYILDEKKQKELLWNNNNFNEIINE